MGKQTLRELEKFATQIRIETVKQVGIRGFGHLGGSLSVTDVLAVLYGDVMKVDPSNPDWKDRDKLVVSKGHAGPAVYSALALKGFFPMDELKTLNQPGTNLPSHCDRKLTKGIDMTTGSLGQGSSAAVGLALAQKLDKADNYTYLILGDGELNEGQIWEAAMFAPQHKLNNLITFVDCNDKQLDGTTEEVLDLGDVGAKFKAFGWHVINIDGNNLPEVYKAVEKAHKETEKPTAIVMQTVKGKGVKFLEDMELNHHVRLSDEQIAEALEELNTHLEKQERGDA